MPNIRIPGLDMAALETKLDATTQQMGQLVDLLQRLIVIQAQQTLLMAQSPQFVAPPELLELLSESMAQAS